jgi:predicted  nucleic acid-binding Zn-ribbon protein
MSKKPTLKDLKSDITVIQAEINDIKSDIEEIRNEIEMLKSLINTIRADMGELINAYIEDMITVSVRIDKLEQKISEGGIV